MYTIRCREVTTRPHGSPVRFSAFDTWKRPNVRPVCKSARRPGHVASESNIPYEHDRRPFVRPSRCGTLIIIYLFAWRLIIIIIIRIYIARGESRSLGAGGTRCFGRFFTLFYAPREFVRFLRSYGRRIRRFRAWYTSTLCFKRNARGADRRWAHEYVWWVTCFPRTTNIFRQLEYGIYFLFYRYRIIGYSLFPTWTIVIWILFIHFISKRFYRLVLRCTQLYVLTKIAFHKLV